jgi:serine/threonine-protein kinase
MKKHGPLATLVAVVLLGAVLLVVNMMSTPTPAQDSAQTAAQTEAAPAPVAASEPAQAAPPAPAEPAPAATPAVAEKAYTGRSAGNEVTVAIAVKDGKAVAYVCDGKKVEAWMEGTLAGGQLTLQGKSSSLSATVTDKATLGSVTVDGAEWPFAAKGVQAPAGLYQGRGVLKGVAARVGWIVEENGNVTGLAVVGNGIAPAPVIDPNAPAAVTVDGVVMTVDPVGGDQPVVAP